MQVNGKLESSHRCIKDCVWKFSIEWCPSNGINYSDMQQLYLIGFRNEHS